MEIDPIEIEVDNMFALTVLNVLVVANKQMGNCDIEIVKDLYKRGGNPNKRRWLTRSVFSAREVVSSTDFSYPSDAQYCARKLKKMFDRGLKELIKTEKAQKEYEEFKKKQEEENNMHSF